MPEGEAERVAFRNRIVGHGVKPADQFLANPANWRRHPQAQRDAMRGVLAELGWVGVVIENVRTGLPESLHISPTTIVESIPPDRNAPNGTSLCRRSSTAEVISSRNWRAYSRAGRSSSTLKSGCQ